METTSTLAHRVAAELRAEMARQGKSVAELSLVLGVTTKTGRTRYNGQTELSLNEVGLASAWLGVSHWQLLNLERSAA